MAPSQVYDPDRVQRLAQISAKFHQHAAPGDEIVLGVAGDPVFPQKYRGTRTSGVVTKVKNAGSENATLRVQLNTGRTVELSPYTLDPEKVWEFSESSWPKVLARSNAEAAYKGAGKGAGGDAAEVASLRQQLQDMTSRFDREMADAKNFNSALVESIAQITSEVYRGNPKDAKFSKVFQDEYRSSKVKHKGPVFDSDIGSDSE